MNDKQKQFVAWLKNRETHEQWQIIVSFSLPTLLEDQDVLAEVLFNEADALAERDIDRATPAECLLRIMGELKLKFTTA